MWLCATVINSIYLYNKKVVNRWKKNNEENCVMKYNMWLILGKWLLQPISELQNCLFLNYIIKCIVEIIELKDSVHKRLNISKKLDISRSHISRESRLLTAFHSKHSQSLYYTRIIIFFQLTCNYLILASNVT